MKRWMSGYLVVALVLALLASSGVMSTAAQDDAEHAQATEISDLQTRVSALETQLAQGGETSNVPGSSDLQTRVADAGGESGATPVSGSTTDGEVLFEANAQTGFSDWTDGYFGGFANQFREENGILVAEPGGYTLLYAPYLTTSPDYILEAEIRLTPPGPGTPEAFGGTIAGLGARLGDWSDGVRSGYTATTKGRGAGIETDVINSLATMSDIPAAGLPDVNDGEWHVYRFEVRGSQLRFLVDGVLILEATDVQFTGVGAGGRVAIVASLGPLEVRAFRVIAWA